MLVRSALLFLVAVFSLLVTKPALARNAELRFMGGVRHVYNRDHFGLNDYLHKQGLPEINKLPTFSFEFGGASDIFGAGFRIFYSTLHIGDNDTGPIENYSKLYSVTVGPHLRQYLVHTDFFRLDIGGGVGLGWGNVATRKNGNEAIIEEGLGWAAWASTAMSFGYRYAHLTVEGGYKLHSMDGLRHKVDEKNGIHDIILSGGYVMVGFLSSIPSGN